MVLGESFKPFSPKPKSESIVLESKSIEETVKKGQGVQNETFIFKYTLSFLAASCAETSILSFLLLSSNGRLIYRFLFLVTYPLDLIKGIPNLSPFY